MDKEINKKDTFNKGILYVLISTLGFSMIPILAKIGFTLNVSASTLLFYRFFIAGLFFIGYAIIRKKQLLLKDKKLYLFFSLLAFIYSIQCLCFFSAFRYISPSIGEIIYYSYPAFVLVFAALFLNEKITKNKVIAVLISLGGMTLVLYSPWTHVEMKGIFLVFITAFVSTLYITLNKKLVSTIDSIIVMTYMCIGCSIFFFFYSISTNTFELSFQPSLWINIIILAVFSTIIGLFCFIKGLSLLNAGMFSIISLMEPIFTVILSYIFFHTILTPLQLLGMLIIIASIYYFEK